MKKTTKRDVLFLCQFFYPEHNSSATLPYDTAKYLASHGMTVDAMCGYPKEYSDEKNVPKKEEREGVCINRIRYLQLERTGKIGRLINYFSFTLSALARLSRLRKYRCVIVYSNPPVLPLVAVLGKILFKTKIIFVAYDVYPEVAYASGSVRKGSLIDKGMNVINKMLFNRVDKVIALTDEMKEFLLEHRGALSAEQIVTVANWAHEKRTDADDAAYERFGFSRNDFVVSYFGNMGICQEMQTLVDAAIKMRDRENIKFFFVGHGCKKDDIESLLKQNYCDNAQMYSFLTGKDFEQAVAVSSCCVVSLERGLRGMCAPSKFYSYLQGGKPVLAIVEEGSYIENEIELNQIGHAIHIGDVDTLVNTIEMLAANRDECARMGERSLKLYNDQYEMTIALDKYTDVVRNVVSK